MPHPGVRMMGRPLKFRWTWCVLLLAALSGCEDDPLTVVGGFEPEDCLDLTRCSEGGVSLDAGSTSMPDSGTMPVDSGSIDTDAGTNTDSGVTPDAGTPDTGPPPTDFLDVSGQWQTQYDFDTGDYLFGISGIADELSLVLNAINGNISTGFPPLDIFIQQVVMQFIPPQIIQVLGVLNSIATFTERMEATGTMVITQHPQATASSPTVDLEATETWSVLTVLIVEQCPLLRQDPNFPQCARYDIPANVPSMAGPLEVGVDAKDFTGTLSAIQNGSEVIFLDREVEVEMGRLILLVVDTIVSIASGGQYSDLNDMLNQIIDCPDLASDAADWAVNNLGMDPILAQFTVRPLIQDQCEDAIDDIVNQVGLVTVDWDVFEYDQHGVAKDFTGDNVADELQLLTVPDGIRNGKFRALISSSMDGTWEGVR